MNAKFDFADVMCWFSTDLVSLPCRILGKARIADLLS